MLLSYTAKCNLYCRLRNLEFIVLTNELYSKGIINEHINYLPLEKKKKLETRVSFRPQFLFSAIWLVDFSAHGNDKLKVLMKSETGQLLHTALSNSLAKTKHRVSVDCMQATLEAAEVLEVFLVFSWVWFFFCLLYIASCFFA